MKKAGSAPAFFSLNCTANLTGASVEEQKVVWETVTLRIFYNYLPQIDVYCKLNKFSSELEGRLA